jgi:hypothetical protein
VIDYKEAYMDYNDIKKEFTTLLEKLDKTRRQL